MPKAETPAIAASALLAEADKILASAIVYVPHAKVCGGCGRIDCLAMESRDARRR